MSTYRYTADNGRTSAFHIKWDPTGQNPPTYSGAFGTEEFNQYLISAWQHYPTCTLSVEGLTYGDLCALLAEAGVTDPEKVAIALALGGKEET